MIIKCLVLVVFLYILNMAVQGLMFIFCPLLLFKIKRRIYGNIFPIQLGFESWTVFSKYALSDYWELMKYCTPMFHRAKVPHLNFGNSINFPIASSNEYKDLEDKTRISRTAIIDIMKRNSHRDIIKENLDTLVFTDSKLYISDLQDFCFELVSKPMMQWLIGDCVNQLTPEFYAAMNYYSANFDPMMFYGLKMDKIHSMINRLKDGKIKHLLTRVFKLDKLRLHQKNVEVCFRSMYKSLNRKVGEVNDKLEYVDDPRSINQYYSKIYNSTLTDYYIKENVTEDEFVWLMNATLWAAIHYPSLILYVSILKILLNGKDLQTEINSYIKNTVKNVLKMYPAAIIPRVLKQTVKMENGRVFKKASIITFSPLEVHSIDKDGPILTGSAREFSCPAINFSIDWISTTIEELMFKKYKHWEFNKSAMSEINYKMVLLHSKTKMSLTLF